jgi:hypothetical protein
MYPSLHENVSLKLEEDNLHLDFNNNDDEESCVRDYDTNIVGRFRCHNDKCDLNGWSSKKVAISIRMYSDDRYNARVYYQRCKGCNRLSKPLLDDTYTEELRIVLRSGMVYSSRCHAIQDRVIVRTRVLYVKDVKLGIAAK